jgi:NAD(P)-dependent dehydrogenase (short-subunit alcohol dehydrogenase family)
MPFLSDDGVGMVSYTQKITAKINGRFGKSKPELACRSRGGDLGMGRAAAIAYAR